MDKSLDFRFFFFNLNKKKYIFKIIKKKKSDLVQGKS